MKQSKDIYDYKSILAQELITFDFIDRLQSCFIEIPDMKLGEFYKEGMKDYLNLGIKPKLFSPGFVISSLYVFVVLLKEEMRCKIT